MIRFYYLGLNWNYRDFKSVEDACDFLVSINCKQWSICEHRFISSSEFWINNPPEKSKIYNSLNYRCNEPLVDEVDEIKNISA